MATVREVIVGRLADFGVTLSKVTVETLLVDQDLGIGDDLYRKANKTAVDTALYYGLQMAAGQPTSVAEGGYSVSYNRKAVLDYCENLRMQLGLSALNTPTLNDRSYLW